MTPIRSNRRHRFARRTAPALALAVAAVLAPTGAHAGTGSLSGRIAATRARENALRSSVHAETTRIQGFQGTIDDLRVRLDALQNSLDIERGQLLRLQDQLRSARARLARLQARLIQDRKVLAAQLVAEYKAPQPDIVTVVLEAHGFADLLERAHSVQRVERGNVAATTDVASARRHVQGQVTQLAVLEEHQRQITAGVLLQRDEVGRLKLAVVTRQLAVARARSAQNAQLGSLEAHRRDLAHRLAIIQAREAAAARAAAPSPSFSGPVGGGLSPGSGPFSSHGGAYGFFPSPGTNYSVGSEPQIAARLDAMGKALSLHLIGVSGYRTPQHSVEVGGFANDPHTQGAASDTPGVEGVPEGVLGRYGLTRPFGGAAEADHIQLAGSA